MASEGLADDEVASDEDDLDPRAELFELSRSLMAHLAWQAECGTTGLPRDPEAKQRVQREWQERDAANAGLTTRGAASSSGPGLSARATPDRASDSAGDGAARGAAAHGAPGGHDPTFTRGAAAPAAAPRVNAPHPSAAATNPAAPESRAAPATHAPRAAAASSNVTSSAPQAARSGAALPLLPLSDAHAHVNTLDELNALVRACTACGLAPTRKNTVFSRGKGTSGLCFVGEGPGADEDAQGEPFVGKAGQLLDQMIQAMGLSRDDVYVCNIVKCRPPDNRKPTPEEMAACRPFLQRQLEILKPEVIVALGATAVTGLVGTTDGITRIRGKWLLYRGETAVMPTFHPAYLLRTPSAKRDVWTDLKEVVRHMGRTLPGKG